MRIGDVRPIVTRTLMTDDDARYIQKPFDTVELVATVRAMLEGDA